MGSSCECMNGNVALTTSTTYVAFGLINYLIRCGEKIDILLCSWKKSVLRLNPTAEITDWAVRLTLMLCGMVKFGSFCPRSLEAKM